MNTEIYSALKDPGEYKVEIIQPNIITIYTNEGAEEGIEGIEPMNLAWGARVGNPALSPILTKVTSVERVPVFWSVSIHGHWTPDCSYVYPTN